MEKEKLNLNKEENVDNIDNLDVLIDDVVESSKDISCEEFDNNRVRTAREVAETELFAIPPSVDMENVNMEMEKGIREKISSENTETENVEVLPETTSDVPLQKPHQEQIDISAQNLTFFTTDQTERERNYRKRLGKLVQEKNPIDIIPFKSKVHEEGDLEVEVYQEENDVPLPRREIDESVGLDKDIEDYDTISVRTHIPSTSAEDANNFLYINKVKIATLAIVSLICLIETLVMYFVINAVNPIHSIYYYIAMLLSIIPVGVGLFTFSFNPNLKLRKKFNYASLSINCAIITILLGLLLLIYVLLSSISLTTPTDYVPKIVLPALFILNYPIGLVVFCIFTKIKFFYVAH